VRIERWYPIPHIGGTCESKGQEWCLPALREPMKPDRVYRTRDGLYRFRCNHVENDRWRGHRAFAVMLSADGFPIHDKAHYFGAYGQFCYPYNMTSPTDLVAKVDP
jgi:hypothetical protein